MDDTMTTPELPARIEFLDTGDGELRCRLFGDWTLAGPAVVSDRMATRWPEISGIRKLSFDAESLGRWDTTLMTVLIDLIDEARRRNIAVDPAGLPDGARGLLDLVYAVAVREGASRKPTHIPWLARIGKAGQSYGKNLRGLVEFVGEASLCFARMLGGRARFRWSDVAANVDRCGPAALGIVSVISLLVGLILAFVGAAQLALFGAQIYIADLVGIGMVREMGALMTAIIMSGRTGAAFAAQLGTMTVNSEIDAFRTMGISPMDFLVLPRMLALIIVMPFLCLYADLLGIVGGVLVTTSFFDVSWTEYLHETRHSVHLPDLVVGLFKGSVFGVLIALAGCMHGIHCGRSASAVGDAATQAVVTSILFIVVADSAITLVCNRLGI